MSESDEQEEPQVWRLTSTDSEQPIGLFRLLFILQSMTGQ